MTSPRPFSCCYLCEPLHTSAVRVRPLTTFEAARIPEETGDAFFMGDGGLAGGNTNSTPSKFLNVPGGSGMYGNVGGMWREVVGEPRNGDSFPIVFQSQPSSRQGMMYDVFFRRGRSQDFDFR